MHSRTTIALQTNRSRSAIDGGYILLGILCAVTVLMLAVAAAAPSAVIAVRRAQEDELIHRGQQYSIAIRRFYAKFGRYPANIEQLENTNNIRFLRRRYLDPLTGKDDWVMIQYGEAQPALAFFGQKLKGASVISPGSTPSVPSTGNGASVTSSNPIANIDLIKGNGIAASGSALGSFPDKVGTPGGFDRMGADSSKSPTNRPFGGRLIVGVSVPLAKQSLKLFRQKDHYNEWQFVYDALVDPTHGLPTGASAQMGGLNRRQIGERP